MTNSGGKLKRGFFITQIGDRDTPERRQADDILELLVQPVLTEAGYTTQRADNENTPGSISEQILRHLIEDELVIADLSHRNPNVFYELAIRHAARKPVIHLIQSTDTIPFDVKDIRTIKYDHRDIRQFEEAKQSLRQQINIIETDFNSVPSPIRSAILNTELRAGETDVQQGIADLLTGFSTLSAMTQEIFRAVTITQAFHDTQFRAQRANIKGPTFAQIRDLFFLTKSMTYNEISEDGPDEFTERLGDLMSSLGVTPDELTYLRYVTAQEKWSIVDDQNADPLSFFKFLKQELTNYRNEVAPEIGIDIDDIPF